MKVGMLTRVDDKCGIARYSRELYEHYDSLVDVDVVPTWTRGEPWRQYLTASADRLNACDVVHVQHEYSFWGSILPGRNRYPSQMSMIHRPMVLTAHTLDSAYAMLAAGPSRFRSLKPLLAHWRTYRDHVERETFDRADRVIVHDRPAAKVLEERGIARAKIRIVPMGVPPARRDPNAGERFRESYGLRGKKLIVIFGFVRPNRGYESIMEILPRLGMDVVLVLAGGAPGPAEQAYLTQFTTDVESRGLRDRVLVTGYLPESDVPALMAAADVILCPQERGTGSYSVQVALGYGRPILASDLPCFEDLASASQALQTFKRGNLEDLASKLEAVLRGSVLSVDLSESALYYADENSWARIAERTVEVYRELVQQ